MPMTKLKFAPGVNRDNTALGSEGTWYECDKIRFRSGQPESLGGWVTDPTRPTRGALPPGTASYWGTCRWLFSWRQLSGIVTLALGTSSKLYLQLNSGGPIEDITPVRLTTRPGTAVLAATAGSSTLSLTFPGHGAIVGDFLTLSDAIGLGGDITTGVLNTEFRVTAVVDDVVQFDCGVPATALDTGNGGPGMVVAFQLNVGAEVTPILTGWGVGAWGANGWGGTAPASATQARLWSGANFGEYLIANPRFGAIYLWRPDPLQLYTPPRAQQLTQQVFTITSANPGVLTLQDPLAAGTKVTISTNGTLPTALPAGTYYVVDLVGGAQGLATTFNGAAIDTTSGSQTGTHSMVCTDCPTQCVYVAVAEGERIVCAFGANDIDSDVFDPLLVRWSAQENIFDWTPTQENQAGFYRLSLGSGIECVMQSRQERLVWTDAALYSMQYAGPPYVYGFTTLAANISLAGPNAVAQASGLVFWMGIDKFYVYSGRVDTLPCTLRGHVFQDINLNQRAQFFAGTNEGFSEIWWFYCSAASETIDRYVIFNYAEKAWYYGSLRRTAWLDTPYLGVPMAAAQPGKLIFHETGADDAEDPALPVPLQSFIQSADFDIADGDRYSFVDKVIPDVSFDGSTAAEPAAVVTLQARQNPGGAYAARVGVPSVVSGNSYASVRSHLVQQFTEVVHVRARGRQMAFRIEANTLGTRWQLGAPRINVRPDGRRS